jgi:hypothetical protein
VAFLNDPRLPTEPRSDSIAQVVAGDRIKAASLAPVALQGGFCFIWLDLSVFALDQCRRVRPYSARRRQGRLEQVGFEKRANL